jgi:cytoskeleton protein RodZ
MSEVAEAPAVVDSGAGVLLRQAREAAGLHVAALAVALKVPVRKLEALEEGRYEDMGDAVFIRALASSVCRTLKIDPQPILDRLPQSSAPRLVRDTDGLNAPFRAPSDAAPPSWRDAVRQPVPLAVIALLVGAVVIALLPARYGDDKAAPAAGKATPAVESAAVAPAAVASSMLTSAPEPAPAASAAVAVGVATAAPLAAAAPATPAIAQASAPATVTVAAPAASGAAPAPATGLVVFRTKGESWVEVTDAKGVVTLRKMMAAGESAGATGALPLKVTIGKVDMTEVQVRGKPFDLKPVSRDNVARFEVK